MLRLSLMMTLFHFLLAIVKYITKNKWDDWFWLFEIPLLIVICAGGYFAMPHFLEIAYGNFLQYAGPLLLILEGIQIVRVVMYLSRTTVNKITDFPQYGNVIKASIVIVSVMGLTGAVSTMYYLFIHPSLTIPLASYLSVVSTFLFVLLIGTLFFVEGGILSDVSFLSLFVAFVARSALLEQPLLHEQQGLFASVFQGNYALSVIAQTFQIGTVQVNFNQFFTFDFLVSAFLAISTILSFPLLWSPPASELDIKDEEEDDRLSFQKNLFSVLLVMLYTHVLLTASGNIAPAGVLWRVLQSALTILFYCYRLVQSIQDDDNYYVNFKQD